MRTLHTRTHVCTLHMCIRVCTCTAPRRSDWAPRFPVLTRSVCSTACSTHSHRPPHPIPRCEPNYAVSYYIAEFANTLSSIPVRTIPHTAPRHT